MLAIYQHCPDSQIFYSSGNMQKDSNNCATFAFDHACRLSKIKDLHETISDLTKKHAQQYIDSADCFIKNLIKIHLEHPKVLTLNHVQQLQNYLEINPFQYILLTTFPTEFGPLIRNFQSLEFLKKSFFDKKFAGNDSLTLRTYVESRIIYGRNMGIELKKENIQRKTLAFVKDLSLDDANKFLAKQHQYTQLFAKAHRDRYRGLFTIKHWLCIEQEPSRSPRIE